MRKHTVELFYDVLSPYAWFGFESVLRYETRWAIDLRLRPTSLQGIMKTTSNSPPATNPYKAKYMYRDIARSSSRFGLPFRFPKDFFGTIGKGSLAPMRFLTVVDQEIGKSNVTRAHLVGTSINLWKRIYSENVDMVAPESIAEAAKKAGMDENTIKKFLAASATQEIKDRLKKVTEEAVESGAFGMPWFRVTHAESGEKEVYFGSDRLDAIAYFLKLPYEGPNPGKA